MSKEKCPCGCMDPYVPDEPEKTRYFEYPDAPGMFIVSTTPAPKSMRDAVREDVRRVAEEFRNKQKRTEENEKQRKALQSLKDLSTQMWADFEKMEAKRAKRKKK